VAVFPENTANPEWPQPPSSLAWAMLAQHLFLGSTPALRPRDPEAVLLPVRGQHCVEAFAGFRARALAGPTANNRPKAAGPYLFPLSPLVRGERGAASYYDSNSTARLLDALPSRRGFRANAIKMSLPGLTRIHLLRKAPARMDVPGSSPA